MKEKYTIISFNTTMQAMKTEMIFKENGQDGRLIPLPEAVKAGCGLAWASTKTKPEYFIEYMKKMDLEYDRIVEIVF